MLEDAELPSPREGLHAMNTSTRAWTQDPKAPAKLTYFLQQIFHDSRLGREDDEVRSTAICTCCWSHLGHNAPPSLN